MRIHITEVFFQKLWPHKAKSGDHCYPPQKATTPFQKGFNIKKTTTLILIFYYPLRYQKKCDELEEMNRDFRKEFDQLTVDKKEIVSFLKKSLEQRGDEITDLNDRLIGLQQAKDTEKEQMEAAIQGVRSEYQENKDRLTSENMILRKWSHPKKSVCFLSS